jgi:hypothetical protein
MSFFSLPQLNKKSEQNTIPTKIGVSLTLPQWKVLCSATQVVDDMISRVKDGEPVDEVSLGVIMTNTEIKIHILWLTLH